MKPQMFFVIAISTFVAFVTVACSAPGGEAWRQPVELRAQPAAPADNAAVAASANHGPLTLDDCIAVALAGNRRVTIADRRILIADNQVDEAWSVIIPRLKGNVRENARGNDSGFGFGGRPSVVSDRQATTAGLSLLVPIYNFGAAQNQLEAQHINVDVARLSATNQRRELAWAVSQAYFRVLESRKIEGVVESSIAVLERQLQITRDFLGEGLAAQNDVLAIEVQLAQRKQEKMRGARNTELAKSTLNRLMGRSVSEPVEIADVLDAPVWRGSFTACLELALSARPDLASLKKQVEMARAEYRAQRADGLYPRLYAFGDYNYSSDSYLLHNDWLSGGIALEVPLFDGGGTMARLAEKEKAIAELRDLHDERVDDIVLDIKQTWLRLEDAAGEIAIAKDGVKLGEENLRVTSDQFGEGLLSSADVLAEEDRLSEARSRSYQTLYEYHASYAGLCYVIGAEPPKGEK